MGALVHDVRLALRLLLARPGFTCAVSLTLALGLGVNAVAFSALNALLFKGHAGTDIPGAGWVFAGAGSAGQLSVEQVRSLAAATGASLEVAAEGRRALPSRHDGAPATVWALVTIGPYFELLGTRPLHGRLPRPDGGTDPPHIAVSERFWLTRLAGAPLSGLTLPLGTAEAAVVGVVADGFRGPGGLYAPDIWLPIESWRALGFGTADEAPWLTVFGTLKPGATPATVDTQLAAAVAAWPAVPETPARRVRFVPMADGHPEAQAARLAAAAGLAVVGLVLLLACVNVTGLLLARATERQREFAVRVALGATRRQIVRQQAVEGALIGALAGACALVLASWSGAILGQFAIPIAMPQRLDVSPDLRVAGYLMIVSLLSGILPGLLPVLRAACADPVRTLAAGGPGVIHGRSSRLRHGLVVLQVAGSTAFLVVAVLLVRSYVWAASASGGFDDSRIVIAEVDLDGAGEEPARRRIDRLVSQVAGLPGVVTASAASRVPFYIGMARLVAVSTGGRPCEPPRCPAVDSYLVDPEVFEALGMRVVEGRLPDASAWAAGLVVNEAFARSQWPGEGAVGQIVRVGARSEPRVVLAVVGDVAQRRIGEPPTPVAYLPIGDGTPLTAVTIVARTAGPAAALVQAVHVAIADAEPGLAVPAVQTMTDRMRVPLWPARTASGVFAACGALAALLAAAGLVGAVLYSVSRRTREFGVRLAMGATPVSLVRLVVGGTIRLAGPGVALGLVAAWGLASAGRAAFIGVEVGHPVTYALVAAAHVLLAAGASVLPARHAARTDPISALRAD
jgi:predicted permease